MHITQNFLISVILNCQNKGMDLMGEDCACLLSEWLEPRNKNVFYTFTLKLFCDILCLLQFLYV